METLLRFAFCGLLFLLTLTYQLEIEKAYRAVRWCLGGASEHDSEQCINRARWTLYLDKFERGYTSVCTPCLLARFDALVHDAELIEKPWIFRGRCCGNYHSELYSEVISDKLELVRLCLRHGEILEAFSDRTAHRVIGGKVSWNGRSKAANRISLYIPYEMERNEMDRAQTKAQWLAEQISEQLEAAKLRWYVDAVRLNESKYEIRLGRKPEPKEFGGGGIQTFRFSQELIDDMQDSDRPQPETLGRFRSAIRELVQSFKREHNTKE